MGDERLKGPQGGILAYCGRCGYKRVVTGKGTFRGLTPEEEGWIESGEGELYESISPPGAGDLCPRCMGDGWVLRHSVTPPSPQS